MNKPSIRTFVLAAAVAATAGGAIGSGAAFADETAAAPSVPAGHSVCVDLPTSGVSGYALGSSDLPLNFTLLVQDDGGSAFTVVASSDGPTSQWRAELPGVTGYTVRTVRACAQNPGDQDSGAFLTIETDDDQALAPVAAPVAGSDVADVPAPDVPVPAIVDDAGLDTPAPVADAVQSVVDRVEALVAEAVAAIG
ncbi:MAG TPA: hypothetical protein VL337_05690 [Acidimicrobiales bacterium]|nr:hypothetical protein [Acidimicrobiales bacterium]